ncbi:hypothetical protein E4T25_04305 [Photobacterium damselae subsp. piscicida]|uniref:hypothetical protein n=1 Tax=Photobacterium damselae TaxID=38293 RepID=UPI00107641ED|nr:hypothetical protein [Photobacterium damselae]TFZ62424.1 hypothetical protein E4T25_04305 [Photobacterium damselae subsp. piscicida]
MNIATLFKASVQTISKENFKRQHPSPYTYLIVRNGFYHLYTSQEPSFARSEAWLKKIQKTEWGLIEPLEDGSLFFMFVGKGDIIKAQVGTFEHLDSVLLERCPIIYLVDDNKLAQRLEPAQHQTLLTYPVELISPLTPPELTPFALKKHKKLPVKSIAAIALLIALGGVGVYAYQEAIKPEPLPPPVDPYLAYRTAVTTAYSASEILNQAVSLGAIGMGLPYGWQLNQVTLDEGNILLTAQRTPKGQRAVILAWLGHHAKLQPYSQVSLDSLTIRIPIQQTLQDWRNKIMSTEPALSSIMDAQIALGWTVTEFSQDNGLVSITSRWRASKETSLSQLTTFSQMLSTLPVTVTQLTIKPTGRIGEFNIQLQFAFMGNQSKGSS